MVGRIKDGSGGCMELMEPHSQDSLLSSPAHQSDPIYEGSQSMHAMVIQRFLQNYWRKMSPQQATYFKVIPQG